MRPVNIDRDRRELKRLADPAYYRRVTMMHRRVAAAGYSPAHYSEDLEAQFKALESGLLKPRAISDEVRRVMANDERRRAERAMAEMASLDDEAVIYREDHATDMARDERDLYAGPESLHYVEHNTNPEET